MCLKLSSESLDKQRKKQARQHRACFFMLYLSCLLDFVTFAGYTQGGTAMKEFIIQTRQAEVPVSKILFGTTDLGTKCSLEESFEFLDYYYAQGGRTIDTARVYGQWAEDGGSKSEEVIEKWLKERGNREDITLITKGAHPPLENLSTSRVNAVEIQKDLEASLATLSTDYVDIYFLHRDDENADLVEIMSALTKAVEEGKVKAIGASNWSAKRMMEANDVAKKEGLLPFQIAQIHWSLAYWTPEQRDDQTLIYMNKENYSLYKEAGIPVVAFGSQGKGIFSQLAEAGEEGLRPGAKRFLNDVTLRRGEKVNQLAAKYQVSPAAIAVSYIADNSLTAGAIIGCSKKEQLADSMTAQGVTLTPQEVDFLVSE